MVLRFYLDIFVNEQGLQKDGTLRERADFASLLKAALDASFCFDPLVKFDFDSPCQVPSKVNPVG